MPMRTKTCLASPAANGPRFNSWSNDLLAYLGRKNWKPATKPTSLGVGVLFAQHAGSRMRRDELMGDGKAVNVKNTITKDKKLMIY